MISEAQLRELLAQKTETRNLDYKQSFNWNTATNDEKYDLIKDILAFFNTQDGGYIIIGVRNSDFELVGLAQDAFISFDTTKMNDFLQRYTDPLASSEVQKLTVDGKNVVVVSVHEFKDIPIVCKKDANSSTDPSKLILKAGGLYIRTEKATSILVPSAETMRDLVDRALLTRGDQLLSTIQALLKGNQGTAKYAKEVESAQEYFRQVLPVGFESNGYWQLIAMPEVYNREKLADFTAMRKLLLESEVNLRGWKFPHTDKETKRNFSSGTQSCAILDRYIGAFRAYQSGLFAWRGAYRENSPDFVRQHGKALSFVNVIYEITAMFLFLKRYYSQSTENAAIHISIELNDLRNRVLVSAGDALPPSERFVCTQQKLVLESDHTVSELCASDETLAIKVVQNIFEVFNWNSPDPKMIRAWQVRLLTRTL